MKYAICSSYDKWVGINELTKMQFKNGKDVQGHEKENIWYNSYASTIMAIFFTKSLFGIGIQFHVILCIVYCNSDGMYNMFNITYLLRYIEKNGYYVREKK